MTCTTQNIRKVRSAHIHTDIYPTQPLSIGTSISRYTQSTSVSNAVAPDAVAGSLTSANSMFTCNTRKHLMRSQTYGLRIHHVCNMLYITALLCVFRLCQDLCITMAPATSSGCSSKTAHCKQVAGEMFHSHKQKGLIVISCTCHSGNMEHLNHACNSIQFESRERCCNG